MKPLITHEKKLKTVTNRRSRLNIRVLNIRSQLSVSTRREPKKKLKLLK